MEQLGRGRVSALQRVRFWPNTWLVSATMAARSSLNPMMSSCRPTPRECKRRAGLDAVKSAL
jgi:hypothetical protein